MQTRTIDIIKNFASINPGLLFTEGNRLRTLSVARNVFATAEIPDQIPRKFAIYDLGELLSTLSLFSAPDIQYKEDHLLISEGKSRIRYMYSSPSVVISPPDKDIQMANPDHTFQLTAANLKQITKASAALKLPALGIRHNRIRAFDPKKEGNSINIDVESTGNENAEERILNIELLKMIEGSYNVEVFARAVRFENVADPTVQYFITVESKENQK